jgi:hypothetical protein
MYTYSRHRSIRCEQVHTPKKRPCNEIGKSCPCTDLLNLLNKSSPTCFLNQEVLPICIVEGAASFSITTGADGMLLCIDCVSNTSVTPTVFSLQKPFNSA